MRPISFYVTLQVLPDEKHAALRIRAATPDDAAAIGRVQQRNGVDREGGTTLHSSGYPFDEEFQDIPTGWVLETEDGSIVGCLDNVHMLYELEGRRIKAAIASGWAVDEGYRGKSLQLMIGFFRQKGIDLKLNVSANPTTADVLTAMRIARVPVPDYSVPCFWAVRPRVFAKAILLRRGILGAPAWAWPAGLLLRLRDMVRRSGRGRLSLPIRRTAEFDDRFDVFWDSLRTGPARLRAVRTKSVLEWRFRHELRDGRIAIVTAEPEGVLSGYAVLVRRPGSELGMALYDIADLQSLRDDPEITRNLLLGSIKIAREDGVDAVKFLSGTPAKRSPADALKPYTYRLPIWQLYYKVASPSLGAALSAAEAWDLSVFDTF